MASAEDRIGRQPPTRPRDVPSASPRPLVVRPVSALGAEVSGVDLREPLESGVRDAIEAALYEHQVLFFRDQPIDRAQHLRFARAFGEIYTHPIGLPNKDPDHPEIFELYSDAEQPFVSERWHSDSSFEPDPPSASILRAVEVPAVGGDTLWASMTAAWEALSDTMQRLLSGLEAVHESVHFMRIATPEQREQIRARGDVVHPVVRTHPATGRNGLYVNATFTRRIVGMKAAESRALLDFLFAHVDADEFHCRFHWTPDAIAFWDNRVTQHRVVADRPAERRRMQRLTLAGERPFRA